MERKLLSLHWVPLTTKFVYKEQPATMNELPCIKTIDCNVKKLVYNEHPTLLMSSFFCIFLLIISKTHGVFTTPNLSCSIRINFMLTRRKGAHFLHFSFENKNLLYRSRTVNSKSFVCKVLLQIKWKFELTVYFKHEILGQL